MKYYKIYINKFYPEIFGVKLYGIGTSYSIRSLKRRLKSNKIRFGLHITLTYNDANVEKASGNDIRKLINRIRQSSRNIMKEKYSPDNFKYVWKREFGKLNERIHYHLLVESPYFLSKETIEKYWDKGFINLREIENRKEMKQYIQKYIVKTIAGTERGRDWSVSRSIKPLKTKKWILLGVLNEVDYYRFKSVSSKRILFYGLAAYYYMKAKKNKFMALFIRD